VATTRIVLEPPAAAGEPQLAPTSGTVRGDLLK
jgi:hypothetical protein